MDSGTLAPVARPTLKHPPRPEAAASWRAELISGGRRLARGLHKEGKGLVYHTGNGMPSNASTAAQAQIVAASAFGRRTSYPRRPVQRHPRIAPLRADPGLLAYALRNEDSGSLRRLVLDRLYERMTPAEQRLCDAERRRTTAR